MKTFSVSFFLGRGGAERRGASLLSGLPPEHTAAPFLFLLAHSMGALREELQLPRLAFALLRGHWGPWDEGVRDLPGEGTGEAWPGLSTSLPPPAPPGQRGPGPSRAFSGRALLIRSACSIGRTFPAQDVEALSLGKFISVNTRLLL